jgi:hypothetical protein
MVMDSWNFSWLIAMVALLFLSALIYQINGDDGNGRAAGRLKHRVVA